MKTCPKCGQQNTDASSWCARCNTALMSPHARQSFHPAQVAVQAQPARVPVAVYPIQVARRFPTLRAIAVALKVLGYILAALSVGAGCLLAFALVRAGSVGVLMGIGCFLGGLISAALALCVLCGSAEHIEVILAIEENTRATAQRP